MKTFQATIHMIGVNPFVFLPEEILRHVFEAAGRNRGPVPVHGTIDGHPFIQTLVRFSGDWRLYVNMPMLKSAQKQVGDEAIFQLAYDPNPRIVPMHPKLEAALQQHPEAQQAFDQLSPSRQKEIKRTIHHLKSEAAVDRNIERAIRFLRGEARFIGRDPS